MTWDLITGFEGHKAVFSLRKLLENEKSFYASSPLKPQDSLCTEPSEIFAERYLITMGRLRVPARTGPSGLLMTLGYVSLKCQLRAFDLLLGTGI